MANTLSNLIPDIHAARDVVSRELIGFIPSVNVDADVARVAIGQDLYIPVTQEQSAADNTPGVTPPDTGDQTIDAVKVEVTKSKHVPIRWNGEQTRGYMMNGTRRSTMADQMAQAMRVLTNLMEADLAATYVAGSRAYGTAGTTPFASTLADASNMKKILDDNGAPMMDRSLVINSTAGVNLRNLTNLNQANAAGTDMTLRQGVLLPLFGMNVRESAEIDTHTAGTGASATTDNAGYAVGETVITLASAGTGTILAGDVITFLGDSNKYVVVSGDADVSGGGTITIAEPGLQKAIAPSTTAITVTSDYTANMAFSRNAIILANRLPYMPEGGDLAEDVYTVSDPMTGITFEVALYKQFRQNVIHVSAAWGTKLIKPEHTALLLG